MRTAGRVLGFSQFCQQPLNFGTLEGHIDLHRGMAGDAGGDTPAPGLRVFGLFEPVLDGEHLFEHVFELSAFETDRR